MDGFNPIGAIIGGLVGWVLAAMFSKGPKSRSQALSGDYERGGAGCVTFLILLFIGAVIGGFVSGM